MAYEDIVQQYYVGFYGRPADPEGLAFWASELEATGGEDFTAIQEAFANSQEYEDFVLLDDEGVARTNEELVNFIYNNLFGRDAETEGLDFYVGHLDAGNLTMIDIVTEVIKGAQGTDVDAFANKVAVATYFTESLGDASYTGDDIADVRALLATVDEDPASLQNGEALVDDWIANQPVVDPGEGEDFLLTVGQDILDGTAGNDTFKAYIFDNQNTFQSGDMIDGGDGTDSLYAGIGKSQAFAINAITEDVENFFFQAQAASFDDSDNAIDGQTGVPGIAEIHTPFAEIAISGYLNDLVEDLAEEFDAEGFDLDRLVTNFGMGIDQGVQIDAQDMVGLEQLWSVDSRANLTIEDVRANSHETTIGWRNTDSGNVNYEVYFKNPTAADPFDEGAVLRLRLLDLDGMETDGLPLKDNPYNGFSFMLDGVEYTVQVDDIEDISGEATFTDLVDAFNAAFAKVPALSKLEASLGSDYTAVNSDSGVAYVGTEILITNTGSGALDVGNWLTPDGTLPPDTNVLARQYDVPPEDIVPLTSVDIVLDNVGWDCKAGDLVLGCGDYCGGIQQFDIQVDRDSWLGELRSTNNFLEVVTAINIAENNAAGDGDLRIDGGMNGFLSGNWAGLTDVRVFDASAMVGDVTLTAELTGAVVGKYMDLGDVQEDPAADNVAFNYVTGLGDDNLYMAISNNNFANDTFIDNVGTTTREDFDLNITTGDGDDLVTLAITDDDGDLANGIDWVEGNDNGGIPVVEQENWYDNSQLNANLKINTGDGNDTVKTPGSGDVIINAGAGDDAIYVDNTGAYPITGRMATWVFNATDDNLQDLESDVNDSYKIYDGALTLSFKGYEATVDLQDTDGIVTDLQFNQAIKNAINNDAVLSKLLVAKDGPANTLVVESLIDGEMDVADLTIVGVTLPTNLSPTEVVNLNRAYGTTDLTKAELLDLMQDDVDGWAAKGDYASNFAEFFGGPEYIGVQSEHISDNTITGGLGDDVIVLGTGAFSNDTVVYEGFENGVDTIVNFGFELDSDTYTVYSQNITEVVTITFGDFDGSDPGSITFDGVEIFLDFTAADQGLIPAVDVAAEFANQYVDNGGTNWTTDWLEGTATVVLTSTIPNEDIEDLTAGDFTFNDGEGSVTIDGIIDGETGYVVGSPESFTLTLLDTIVLEDGSIEFDGATIDYAIGDGLWTLHQAFLNADYANWEVTGSFNYAIDATVTFTAIENGDIEDGDYLDVFTDADLVTELTAADISLTAVKDADGVEDTGTATEVTVTGLDGIDYIDFTDYDVDAVYVDGGLVAGTDSEDMYVAMTESATNAGEYEMEVFEVGEDGVYGGGDDVSVGVIGVADFGDTVAFVPENFII